MERNKSAKIKNSAEKSSGEILPRDTEGNLMKSVAQTIIEADRFYTIAAKTGSVIQAVESVKDGGNIRLGKYEHKPEQEWAFVREGDGVYRIRNRASGKLIDLMMTGTANGTWLHLWEDVGGTSQMWKMEPTPDGTGKCIDTVGMGTADGAVLQIWQETAGEDQLWTISEVKDRAKHAPKSEEKPAEVKAEAAAPAEEKPVEEKAAPAVKKTTRKPAAKKTAAKTAAKSAGAKAEAAPAKAEEKPAEAAPAAKPARKTAARKKTTKASK